jgi:hypothetical protein
LIPTGVPTKPMIATTMVGFTRQACQGADRRSTWTRRQRCQTNGWLPADLQCGVREVTLLLSATERRLRPISCCDILHFAFAVHPRSSMSDTSSAQQRDHSPW